MRPAATLGQRDSRRYGLDGKYQRGILDHFIRRRAPGGFDALTLEVLVDHLAHQFLESEALGPAEDPSCAG